MTGRTGIFWGLPQSDGSWTILTDATALSEAEPYGEFLTHPRGHYEVWEAWQTMSAAARKQRKLPETVVDYEYEYEYFPRGRIVYSTTTKQYILYADKRLQKAELIGIIAELFHLAPGTFIVRSDAHYSSR